MPTSLRPPKPKQIVMVAGEASGDHHAAHLITQIKKTHPHFEFAGIGGQAMEAQGVHLIYDLARYGIFGFTEVIKHLFTIRRAFKAIKQFLTKNKPDLLVLVDYPGFNLRLAKVAHALGIKVLYYISPQIWAWKKGRIEHIKKYVNHMAVVLPFEVSIYQNAKVPVSYVGHPLTHMVKANQTPEIFKQQYHIPADAKIIGLLPGSRHSEISRLLPVILESAQQLAQQHENLHFLMPLADTVDRDQINDLLNQYQFPITIVSKNLYNALNCCHSAIVCSGTVTLETALMGVPMVIIYKGSAISIAIAKRLVSVDHIGLCNLIAEERMVPELIQHEACVDRINEHMKRYLDDDSHYQNVKNKLAAMQQKLKQDKPDQQISQVVIDAVNAVKHS